MSKKKPDETRPLKIQSKVSTVIPTPEEIAHPIIFSAKKELAIFAKLLAEKEDVNGEI